MILKSKTHNAASAWATPENGRVQLQIGPLRFTADADEAIELAAQLAAAVDKLRGGK